MLFRDVAASISYQLLRNSPIATALLPSLNKSAGTGGLLEVTQNLATA